MRSFQSPRICCSSRYVDGNPCVSDLVLLMISDPVHLDWAPQLSKVDYVLAYYSIDDSSCHLSLNPPPPVHAARPGAGTHAPLQLSLQNENGNRDRARNRRRSPTFQRPTPRSSPYAQRAALRCRSDSLEYQRYLRHRPPVPHLQPPPVNRRGRSIPKACLGVPWQWGSER
jgi:hypothetical protein